MWGSWIYAGLTYRGGGSCRGGSSQPVFHHLQDLLKACSFRKLVQAGVELTRGALEASDSRQLSGPCRSGSCQPAFIICGPDRGLHTFS